MSEFMTDRRDEFSGDPATRWVTSEGRPDRQMAVLEEFVYWDRDGTAWSAPPGVEVNGASIPRPLWAIVGSPFTGDYRRASIVHDVACASDPPPPARKAADRMYYFACLRGGCSKWEATRHYIGVRIGAWIPSVRFWKAYDARHATTALAFERQAADASIVGTFYEIASVLEPRADMISFEEMEAEIDRQLAVKSRQ